MIARVAACVALALLAGCASRLVPPDPHDEAWSAVRAAHTCEVRLYDGLAVGALGTATWDSPALREARVERLASWRAAPPEEARALRAAEAAEAAEFDDFTLALFVPERAENDLDSRRTSWRVALVQEGAPERLPAEVRALRSDAQLRALYPTIGDFDTVYRIRFRKAGALAPPFTLRLAGPIGRMDFAFVAPAGPAVAH